MKGIIFTEFLGMMENEIGLAELEAGIEEANLPNGGAYTSIGTYDHAELFSLIMVFSKRLNVPPGVLVKRFGKATFGRFAQLYGAFFEHAKNAFDMLLSIESYIHPEVRKLYPDAQVPNFKGTLINENTLELIYESPRAMHDLADGLIEGCFEYYGESFSMKKELLSEQGNRVKYIISK